MKKYVAFYFDKDLNTICKEFSATTLKSAIVTAKSYIGIDNIIRLLEVRISF